MANFGDRIIDFIIGTAKKHIPGEPFFPLRNGSNGKRRQEGLLEIGEEVLASTVPLRVEGALTGETPTSVAVL